MGWMIGGSSPGGDWEFFSSPLRPDRLRGPPNLLCNGYQGLFPLEQSGRGVKLTTHLHLVARSIMRGAIPPLPQYAFMAWYSVKKKHRDNFTFTNILLLNVPLQIFLHEKALFLFVLCVN
jgi:hypothetical protein